MTSTSRVGPPDVRSVPSLVLEMAGVDVDGRGRTTIAEHAVDLPATVEFRVTTKTGARVH